MPEKNISDVIQSILDKNKGFVLLSKLPALLSNEVRQQLGIKKSKENVAILQKKIETAAPDMFMFRKKGQSTYILIPCQSSDIVLAMLNPKKPLDTRSINALPFTKKEFIDTVNALVESGQAKITLTKDYKPQIFLADTQAIPAVKPVQAVSAPSGEYTQEKFREAFDVLKRGRITVRICDLRRRLNWPRDVFDNMLVALRDAEVIELRTGDTATMTVDEVQDCFIDEHGFRRGLVIWNG